MSTVEWHNVYNQMTQYSQSNDSIHSRMLQFSQSNIATFIVVWQCLQSNGSSTQVLVDVGVDWAILSSLHVHVVERVTDGCRVKAFWPVGRLLQLECTCMRTILTTLVLHFNYALYFAYISQWFLLNYFLSRLTSSCHLLHSACQHLDINIHMDVSLS